VKRLRPVALGPAGLITQKKYLEELSNAIEELQTTPGRLSQSANLSSLDSWIRLYRHDENSENVSISYYTKGEVLGFLLDSRIRAATRGAKSLDDVMRLAYQRYSGQRGFTPEEFEAVGAEVGGKALGDWLHRFTNTTEELDYKPALEWTGLAFAEKHDKSETQKEEEKLDPRVMLGVDTRNEAGRLVVAQVRPGTTAYDSGIEADDEIIAIDGFRVTPDQWQSKLQDYRPGDKARLTVARRQRLMTVDVAIEKEPEKPWHLDPDPKAGEAQKEHLKARPGE
jgi:predicted metalloprotease with PDZ domain